VTSTESPDCRWVEIGFVVLEPSERAQHLPADTAAVPYYVRLKGFAGGDPQIGQRVEVETLAGRRVEGEVLRLEPEYGHSFGGPIRELIEAGSEARLLLRTLGEEA
jgi:hypothetical protein